MSDQFFYTEVSSSRVPPETRKAGEEAFDFLRWHYETPNYKAELRWLKRGGSAYNGRVISIDDRNAGKKFGRIEFNGDGELSAFTWVTEAGGKRSVSLFLTKDISPSEVSRILAHQIYHALLSERKIGGGSEQEEKAADRFADRVLKEMKEEADEPARDRIRKVYWNQGR